jgi:hypothetical protein
LPADPGDDGFPHTPKPVSAMAAIRCLPAGIDTRRQGSP